nr:immunoglobulin light chain junction region [Macaca mulatta]MOX52724.1 immunoglobulin light chain junction region [Macaca mulatta]MOX52741.1 immunoglobulin light chain junction region [Macaca mulatta]MOX52928.1 immunoglobulin light chain junction region [Macaca mulatta]MOX53090.1 immunoglobulin light chain junction region [Macaca mulatta]
CQQYFNRPFTF